MERSIFLPFCSHFLINWKAIITSVFCASHGSSSLIHRQKNVEGHCSALTNMKQSSLSLNAVCEIIPVFWAFFWFSASLSQLQFAIPGAECSPLSPFWLGLLFLHLCSTVHTKAVLSHLMPVSPQSWEPRHNPASPNGAMVCPQSHTHYGAQAMGLLMLPGSISCLAKHKTMPGQMSWDLGAHL